MTLPGTAPPESLRLSEDVWGIDPSTQGISLAALQARAGAPGLRWGTMPMAQQDGGPKRLGYLYRDFTRYVERLLSNMRTPPAYVVLEQPFGGSVKPKEGKKPFRPHPQSYYVVGVVQAVLANVLGSASVVELIDPMTWKRDAMGTGHGGADKLAILKWARSIGYQGDVQDEADALGIATCAGVRWTTGAALT